MNLEVGVRVVRGPDWQWDQQDGGEGFLGTVTEVGWDNSVKASPDTAVVVWDRGYKSNYRVGYGNAFDLCVYDNAPVGIVHSNLGCSSCKIPEIIGIRYKCAQCANIDLCFNCYMMDEHDLEHQFSLYSTKLSVGTLLPSRVSSQKIQSKGIFVGAKVIRGVDWEWDSQDGGVGSTGQVVNIRGWDKDSNRSVANVIWTHNRTNVYRIGHKGKVDLRCIQESLGIPYYEGHLPVLGKETLVVNREIKNQVTFAPGDEVKIGVDENSLKVLQVGHGGWNPRMTRLIGHKGIVHRITDKGDVRVKFEMCHNRWTFNPAALKKYDTYSLDDMVRIIDDINQLKELQKGHGEWHDLMNTDAGKVGKVIKLYSDGDLRVSVGKNTWTMNSLCVSPYMSFANDVNNNSNINNGLENALSGAESTDNDDSEDVLKYLTTMISDGNLDIVRSYFNDNPELINLKSTGKTCLHVACHEGRLEIVRYLLTRGATLNVADEDGDVELHYATYGNQPLVLEDLLTNYPVNVNTVNKRSCSPLHIAVNKQLLDCVNVLLRHEANVNLQDIYGDTVLHDAIGKDNVKIFNVLCDQPNVDFSLANHNGFNALHHAALKGNKQIMNKLIEKAKELIDVKKDDGFAPLHLACLNGHYNVANILITKGEADFHLVNHRQQTPLHLAVYQGAYLIMEMLVRLGANIIAQDENGDTPLHYVFQKKVFNDEKIEFNQSSVLSNIYTLISQQLEHLENKFQLAVACFLVQYGALLDVPNKSDITPKSLIADEQIIHLLESKKITSFTEHGGWTSSEERYRKLTPSECFVCSELASGNVTFEPCGHKIACEDCSSRMKKCVECGIIITKRITDDNRIISVQSRQSNAERLRYLERKIAEIEEVHNCSICMERRKTVVFLCGHAACSMCSASLKTCHMCRTVITQKINIY